MISILVYPNITYSKDLEKDSYVVVLSNVIKELNKVRDDLFFTILSPKFIKSLKFHNTKQVPIQIPTYPNQMRLHFNSIKLLEAIDWKNNDYDIVYSHLPEHTLQLKNLFYNETNIKPKFIGYCHWFEVKENTAYSENVFLNNIAGILQMDECGVNSKWLKKLVIDRAAQYYNKHICEKLDKIIQPHYLGVDSISTGHKYKEKTILFNHRPNNYTGWSWFVDAMDILWKRRKDFKIYTTLTKLDKPYAHEHKAADRNEYLEFVRSMYIGVGCFEKYSAWSISTTDGLSQGTPYLLPKDLCYPEMVGDGYPLFYNNKSEFLSIIEELLDSPRKRDIANDYLSKRLDNMKWANSIDDWFKGWDVFNFKEGKETDAYLKIKDYVKEHGEVSKKDLLRYMNWGVRIGFSGYRNRLRNDGIDVHHDRYTYA